MNNDNSAHHKNRFFDGFIWGFIIGAAVVFFLGTKKGKKLFKAITEEGVGNLSDLIEENTDFVDEVEEEEDLEEKVSNGNGLNGEKPTKTSSSSIKKRFFRKKS